MELLEEKLHGQCSNWRPAGSNTYLFDSFFEASFPRYPYLLEYKPVFKTRCELALKDLTKGIMTDLPAERLIAVLQERIKKFEYSDHASFALNFRPDRFFAPRGTRLPREVPRIINCVSYATAMVCALEMLGRYDILNDIKVKKVSDHVWLYYEVRGIDINGAGRESTLNPLESLLASNLTVCARRSYALDESEEALKRAEEACIIDPSDMEGDQVKAVMLWKLAKDAGSNRNKALAYYEAAMNCYDSVFDKARGSYTLNVLGAKLTLREEYERYKSMQSASV